VTLEITGSRRSRSDPDPKMAGERGQRSANQFVNGPSPERGNDEDAPTSDFLPAILFGNSIQLTKAAVKMGLIDHHEFRRR
jgi:hypothetical protein